MPHRHHDAASGGDEAPSPRPSASGCYAFLTRSHRAGAYRRLHSAPALEAESEAEAAAVRVEVRTATKGRAKKSVFHVDPAVLEAGPVRRLLAASGRRAPGGGVAVDVDALLFEHLLWLATNARDGVAGDGEEDSAAAADDLSEIVEFYSQDDDDDDDDRDHELSL
ncbi:auxin-responsive protein SAUR76-like [Miscanthus floridulus]|uniref:auxin-responsive protein SAUR76-like n=1 Tax=Miscanthus floridulus TaxID=154761 RepID=UPI0034594EC5